MMESIANTTSSIHIGEFLSLDNDGNLVSGMVEDSLNALGYAMNVDTGEDESETVYTIMDANGNVVSSVSMPNPTVTVSSSFASGYVSRDYTYFEDENNDINEKQKEIDELKEKVQKLEKELDLKKEEYEKAKKQNEEKHNNAINDLEL